MVHFCQQWTVGFFCVFFLASEERALMVTRDNVSSPRSTNARHVTLIGVGIGVSITSVLLQLEYLNTN